MRASFHIATENRGWVIEKIMNRTIEQFERLGIEVLVGQDSCIGDVDAHFFMHFQHVEPCSKVCRAKRFVFVYHFDDIFKLLQIVALLWKNHYLLVISNETRNRINRFTLGIFSKKVFSVGIASDISNPGTWRRDTPLICGVSSHVYPDGRKNESWIVRICQSLDPSQIEFEFVGKRWDPIVRELRELGFRAIMFNDKGNSDKDYSEVIERMKGWDLALYLGFDEGSLGILDAVLLGREVLVSLQGFHLELGLQEGELFRNYSEFERKIKARLSKRKSLVRLNSYYSWKEVGERVFAILNDGERSNTQAREKNGLLDISISRYPNGLRIWLFWINSAKSLKRIISKRIKD